MKAPILTCVALLTLPAVEDSPKFVRAEADVVSSAWTVVTTRKTESAVMTLTGNDQDVGSDVTTVTTLSLELLDEFTAVTDEGKPLEISRTYETLSRDVESDSADGEGVTNVFDEGLSELEGQSVTFAYDLDTEEWSAAYAEGSEGDEDWLDGLTSRVDLASLIPAGADAEPIEVGSSWDLPSSFMEEILRPGGSVMVFPEADLEEPDEGSISITLPGAGSFEREDEFEGDLVATLVEIVEEEDGRFAKISIKVDVSAELDVIDKLDDSADERGVDEAYEEATLARALEGELTVIWNLEEHRPESMEGDLEGDFEFIVNWTLAVGEMELEIGYRSQGSEKHAISTTFGD